MLRDLALKIEYNSENDDVLRDFFIPCFSACTTFDRCVDYFALKNLISLVDGFGDFAAGNVRMRLIVGHKFGIRDVNILSKMFLGTYSRKGSDGPALDRVMRMILEGRIKIRIAVPASDESSTVFNERLGIFGDDSGNMVAFSGTLVYSPGGEREFETVDVFTSWNDPERVARKRRNFQYLWEDKAKSVRIHDFADADRHGLLKYSSDWAVHR